MAATTLRRRDPLRYATLAVVSLLCIAGCATNTSELKQDLEVLLKRTMSEVRQETARMDAEMARLRSEVAQLRAETGQTDAEVERLGSAVGQLGSEVAILQTDTHTNDTLLVELTARINQLDRRVARHERPAPPDGEQASEPAAGRRGAPDQPMTAARVFSAAPLASPRENMPNGLKQGMMQQDVLRMFGSPHGQERILDAVYWYYADGELRGQYVRFDATSGMVNGWSTFSPQGFQLDLQTTQGGHAR
jgi:hypothetical protein